KLIHEFGLAVQWVLRKSKRLEVFLTSQYQHERLADASCDLYAASCTLSRLDHLLSSGSGPRDVLAGRHFLKLAFRRVRQNLAALSDNEDVSTTATADAWLK